ncbi:conserved oligomeric Golgi complex subunit 3-like isoform X2 [Gigantopelta aegis]|uniref:conserved oligomeric Golgi complex subunit 3-like isoform X2 n=1 Tax=Gigantopelta aegis TaxID=1735272 RepID=UPI001B888932|nr:conserved oligomeric Golgi complex subunit 3-like isoform X2 [Gigantopelta aegis]
MADTSMKLARDRLSLWESKVNPKAPLTDKQKNVLMELTATTTQRPFPEELPADDLSPGAASSVPQTPPADGDSPVQLSSSPLMGGTKVENAQQFFSWFSELEDALERDEESQYRDYIEELCGHRDQCKGLYTEVLSALRYLDDLNSQYVNVSTKTNALHDACEHLLSEQTKLMNIAESISSRLSYFNELDRISSKLGSPTLTVTDESFVPMLSRLDECIHYLNTNPRFKESDVYLLRFKQSLSRALGLIKTSVTIMLQNSTQHVQPSKDVPHMTENAFTLFYGKFRANASRIKPLTEQLEIRVDKSPEYMEVLTDCHNCYFQQRELLIGPSIVSTIADLATKHSRDHCALVRSGCAFMVHVCEDEYQLFFNFFSTTTPLLDKMLERLCTNLYDVFRPFIIHVNHLETLAELCSILKIEMMEEHVENNPKELAAFQSECSQMLMDVQERLVYRTYMYIKADILNYKGATGDLAYPEKLEMMESIAEGLKSSDLKGHSRSPSTASSTSQEVAEINSNDKPNVTSDVKDTDPSAEHNNNTEQSEPRPLTLNIAAANDHVVHTKSDRGLFVPSSSLVPSAHSAMPMSPADLHGMWYPTVRRTLVTLSKLYRCIDKTTFQGLSQEALYACIQSLLVAKDGIIKRKTMLDGQLFLIKHLLILREQIAPFHADFSIRETQLDFTKFKDAAYSLLQKKSQLFVLNSNNSLLQFILEGTPQVKEYFVDSKRDVDQQLKKTCEEFIHTVTETFIRPLQTFLSRADVIINMKKEEVGKNITLRQQPFATPEKVHDVVTEAYRNVKTKLPGVQRSMSLYLANRETENILFKPIKVNVLQSFKQLSQIVGNLYQEEDQQIIACPSTEQLNLLLSTTPS